MKFSNIISLFGIIAILVTAVCILVAIRDGVPEWLGFLPDDTIRGFLLLAILGSIVALFVGVLPLLSVACLVLAFWAYAINVEGWMQLFGYQQFWVPSPLNPDPANFVTVGKLGMQLGEIASKPMFWICAALVLVTSLSQRTILGKKLLKQVGERSTWFKMLGYAAWVFDFAGGFEAISNSPVENKLVAGGFYLFLCAVGFEVFATGYDLCTNPVLMKELLGFGGSEPRKKGDRHSRRKNRLKIKTSKTNSQKDKNYAKSKLQPSTKGTASDSQ